MYVTRRIRFGDEDCGQGGGGVDENLEGEELDLLRTVVRSGDAQEMAFAFRLLREVSWWGGVDCGGWAWWGGEVVDCEFVGGWKGSGEFGG